MSELTGELRRAQARLDLARANQEGPEVTHALMLDISRAMEAVDTIAGSRYAAEVRATAATLVPMFGMSDALEFDRIPRWRWRKRRAWRPTDYTARIQMYREKMV